MSCHQAEQHQWQGNNMEREEAVQSCVRDHVIAANPQRQVLANNGNSREQINNYLRAPVGHLAPRKKVTKKSFAHKAEVNEHAENPQQFTWLAVGTVHQPAEHMEVNHDEKH